MEDALSTLLHDVRPRGALFDQSAFAPPWSLRFVEPTPLTLLTMLRGEAWVTPDGGEAVPLRPWDVMIVLGPEPYTVSDNPGTPPRLVVHGPDRCTTPDGRVVVGEQPICGYAPCPEGTEGTAEAAETVLIKGTYQVSGSVSGRVLDALPRIARIPVGAGGCPALDMIAYELDREAPGQQVVLDRLLDLLLVMSLREWFEQPEAQAPAWYRAHGDPMIGRALRLIHGDPARAWTVAGLATEAGASRARFAQRFSDLMGQSPMAYLTEWRICQAADLLARTDATVEAVSRQVGYSNAYALSVAFKRTMGVRPGEHRARSRDQVARGPAWAAGTGKHGKELRDYPIDRAAG
ncbi:AraC family transcriptional regulator [Streptomyces amakusaensis]|uniref:AraC family transcriptional regulator n=1 Tax=Streptomyces amakusaensis TaxID=67271 RepID=A0ABW0AP88_9ACTN